MRSLDERELVLERIVLAPAEVIWKCWTNSEHLKPWFCPKPWLVTDCRIDLRAGGEFYTLMKSPDGEEHPNHGICLEIIPNQKFVFTDAYTAGWIPSKNPFFTGIIELESLSNGKTKYTARARHWTLENCKQHSEMGFYSGWGIALDQLLDYIKINEGKSL
ncbi:MAG TPA: SRPBCC family protein [Leptospiraceae bacterium]|nr:SRPBCC family protein [Leptospiraceae bacterium]